MTDSEYIEQRLDDQIKWYSKKSTSYKKRHMFIEIAIIISSATIPILTLLHYYFNSSAFFLFRDSDLMIALLGFFTSVIAGYSKLNKLQENWLNYREISETLKHEKFLYLACAGPYSNCENAFSLLVERCENIISHENLNWTQINRAQN